MSTLSPAAQAVASAYDDTPEKDTGNHRYFWLSAALRAAAEEVEDLYCESDVHSSDGVVFAMRQLVLIAKELEGMSN
jgi:hypothetical protein